MKKFCTLVVGLFLLVTVQAEYKITLTWDEFEGECNGFLSGTSGDDFGFLSGTSSASALDGKMESLGEGRTWEANQVFYIHAEEGFYTFWIKDKFADEDMMADPNLILRAQPVVRIYRNEQLLTSIFVSNGEGLSCRVFTLDAEAADVEEDVMFYPGTRLILGSVIDAASGQPLPEAKISLTDYTRETWDMLSDQEGKFIFNVDIGEYKLDVAKPGYIGYSYLIRMGADETPREVTCALSEEIREYRIVLTWNRKPEDLDAHLTGPHPQGDIFHIWYRNKIIIAGKDFLDCDDMNGYGPETITIYEPAKGEYYYSVHDYSNRNKKRSNRLSYSNARVQVYGENRLLAAFEVPVDQKGNCWHVFKIDQGNQIVTINTIDFIADERNIR